MDGERNDAEPTTKKASTSRVDSLPARKMSDGVHGNKVSEASPHLGKHVSINNAKPNSGATDANGTQDRERGEPSTAGGSGHKRHEDRRASRKVAPTNPLARRTTSVLARKIAVADRKARKLANKLGESRSVSAIGAASLLATPLQSTSVRPPAAPLPAWERALVLVLQSWWYVLFTCALAILMTATDSLALLSSSQEASDRLLRAMPPALSAFVLLDTAVQMLMRWRRRVDWEVPPGLLELIDVATVVCYLVGTSLLVWLVDKFDPVPEVAAHDYERFVRRWEAELRSVSHALLMAPLLTLVTGVHRRTCWAMALFGRRADATR